MRETELGLIGCVIIDNDSLYKVYDKLRSEMFAEDFCKECYETMLALYDRSENINDVSLARELENRKWDRSDIQSFLFEAIEIPTSSIEIVGYAKTIIQDYKVRELKKVMQRVSLLPNKVDDSMAEIMARIDDLSSNREQNLKSMKQIVSENKENYFCEKETKMQTGFEKLDNCLNGLEKGDIIVIGARPAVGKSAISLQIIVNACEMGYRVGYYNLEMTENQIYERVVSKYSKLGLSRIKNSVAFIGEEKARFDSANEKASGLNMVVGNARKVSEIKAEAKHQKYDLIVIDYLQLLEPERNNANRAVEVGSISKAAKRMAKELNVPVVLLSQLHRKNQYNETEEPTMDELRESGDIEQDASVVILMWNLNEDRTLKGLKVDKNRQGTLTKIGLVFNGDDMEFEETADFKATQILAQRQSDNTVDVDDAIPF